MAELFSNLNFWKTTTILFLSLKLRQSKVIKVLFSKLTVSPPWVEFLKLIFPGKIFCVKRPQLSETAKIRAITPGCWPPGGVGCGHPCLIDIEKFSDAILWLDESFQYDLEFYETKISKTDTGFFRVQERNVSNICEFPK